ncbi:MAG: AAA family ATPase, partial [Dehalococcoidia bacterium]
ILDEPTTGLDPQARRNLWELIQQIHSQGKTVVLTTHYMEEAEFLCHRVAIMDMGRIIALDTPQGLIHGLDAPYKVKVVASAPLPLKEVEEMGWGTEDDLVIDGTSYQLRVKDAPKAVSAVLALAGDRGITVEHLEVVPATLEDVFLELTGKELRD